MKNHKLDHGGALDAAVGQYGGQLADWLDLSTGINPVPYPAAASKDHWWTRLPLGSEVQKLESAARSFWNVPDDADVLAAPGASSLIARLPSLLRVGSVRIPQPTYNEHAAAFESQGWSLSNSSAEVQVVVHPNNPDGRLWSAEDLRAAEMVVIDESFCDTCPENSLIDLSSQRGHLVLKSFGKFWGLAGARLGFAIGDPDLISRLRKSLGPWPVSGPAIEVGSTALLDHRWANEARVRLGKDARRLDSILSASGYTLVGGTSLFRLYRTDDAAALQDRLAQARIWSRTFPYSTQWLRLGLPGTQADWARLENAI